MAAIIQEGQMSAPTQGGLFQGKSFWLSARVPMRKRFTEQIKVNGGNVVLSEKDADILIVDHLRDHTGDTAFSYKFIEKSIENKKLEDLDDHIVVPVGKKKTSKASGLKGRNTFTQEDDNILFEKLASVDSGYNGNKIYQELHKKYPHHTMHSWRGRWVDHFSKLKDSQSRLEKLKEIRDQMEDEEESDQLDLTESHEEPEVIPAKNGLETFTKEDEAILQKMAVELLASSGGAIYEKLSRRNPRHTPEEWSTYFNKIMLPRIAHKNTKKTSDESSSNGHHDESEDEEQPISLISEGKAMSRSVRNIEEALESTPSSLNLKGKKLQPPVNTKSPLRTMSVRESPRYWSKEGNKPLADLQPHKNATNSSTEQMISTTKDSSKAVDETIATDIPENLLQQKQRKKDEPNKGKTSEITPLSHDKVQSDILQNIQKRKREKEAPAPGQRKRKRNFHDVIESTPEAEPTIQSRVLSPELGQSSQKSSPPVVKKRGDKKYGEMSTQALYDQLDRGELLADMEFPELELPSTPTSSPAVPPPPPPKEQATPPSKPLPKTPASAWESSPTSPKDDDSSSIIEMSVFLDYCQEKYRTSEKKVIDAIERTNGVRALVEVILGCDATGQAPPDLPGIWTREQDQILLGADSKVIKELAETKGEEQMLKRMEFLNMWNRA
ncbi:uncharacterized protein H6S33_000260 [Morchella sextelata]|uniref:uncharacterized protein n=1 Tax=Morchella sextelata TaxID=1174677 RepID=UPI001D0562AB|nr:uncharacterized protein H6S33_000260 [Morchella sextelata]KAH0614624.1 hypothetical protein H6S33_000260 [Morchella sextelata]